MVDPENDRVTVVRVEGDAKQNEAVLLEPLRHRLQAKCERRLRCRHRYRPGLPGHAGSRRHAVPPARGDLGINPPTLLGLAASAPYFHSGQARTLDDVMNNVAHRTAGSPGQDLFTDAGNRALMARFLRSIEANKPLFAGP
jgi:cytochrome c peroxidase